MKNSAYKKSIIWFAIFIVFTLLVKFVDVQPVGPDGSMIGFASINKAVFDAAGTSVDFYKMTQYCGIFSLGIVLCFAILGLDQLIKRKSLIYVDSKVLAMGVYYVIIAIFYALFLFLVINYRPVYINNAELESSYPSSHTMLAITVVAGFMMYNDNFKSTKNKLDRTIFRAGCWIFIAFAAVGRVLSGVHWLTDVIGSIILSIAIIESYKPLCETIQNFCSSKDKNKSNTQTEI